MNTGNTAFMMICTALVFFMTPGLAFFYGGLVRRKNVCNTMMACVAIMGLSVLLWTMFGYSLSFGGNHAGIIGDFRWAFLNDVGWEAGPYADTIPHLVFAAFQMMFAMITPALITGAVVGRMRFKALFAFIALWSFLVYYPMAHMVWGEGGFLAAIGSVDFAGGNVVHISSGVSALVLAIYLGRRKGYEKTSYRIHNIPFVVLGASLLWFGWFGFNAGSALAAADLLNEEEIELIRSLRPGLIQLEIGIQSTNKQTIKEINRSMNLEKVRDKVARIHEKGNVHQHLDLIAGLPYENYDSFAHSFNEVYAMEPDQFQLGFLKVLHGSVMHEKMKEYELLCQNRPPYEVLSTKWLPYSDVIRLKKVEEMVEVYYNSFQFSHTMRLLVELFPSALSMYEKMGNYYEKKGLFGLNHSRLTRYEILWDFVESELAEFTCSEEIQKKEADFKEKVLESMTLDLYLRDNVKNRPAFLGESKVEKDVASEFYKKEAEEHKYLKDYEGYDSRQLRKMTHLERLDGKLHLFDYRHRNKLNQDAAIYIIED